MDIFPVGTVAASVDTGTIDSVSYSMFEPNLRCKSSPIFSVLTTKFDQQTMLTRKKAEPYQVIQYEYENIYDSEYRQIEHFVYSSAEGGNAPFHVVDFSAGIKPTSVTASLGDWIVAINNTRLYSTAVNKKSCRAFLWTGSSFKEGDVNNLVANTSITVDIDTLNYGSLTATDANSYAWLYPIYECYLAESPLSSFNTTFFIDDSDVNARGWMRSGTVSFMSKYKV